MELRSDEYVDLKGKQHPLWKGVLRVAIENGLTELSVRLLQPPSEENGGMAICEATAVFTGENGQVRRFVELGDCDGKNCGPMIAPHRIRMSATRAKGRALRDALGIGEAMAEEMGGAADWSEKAPESPREPVQTVSRPIAQGAPAEQQCAVCKRDLTPAVSKATAAAFGRPLCSDHAKEASLVGQARVPAGTVAG